MKPLYPSKECAACRTLEQHGLPSMFENGEADYDEQANIALLMSAPIDWMEQAPSSNLAQPPYQPSSVEGASIPG